MNIHQGGAYLHSFEVFLPHKTYYLNRVESNFTLDKIDKENTVNHGII